MGPGLRFVQKVFIGITCWKLVSKMIALVCLKDVAIHLTHQWLATL